MCWSFAGNFLERERQLSPAAYGCFLRLRQNLLFSPDNSSNSADEVKMSSNPMVLIRVIHEEEDARNSLKLLLEEEGWKVRLYFSIKDFFDNDDPMIPGCLISNIRLREASGLELQIRLKKTECPMPLIYISAYADVGTAVMALREGAYDFLTKPINDERLLESVEAAVNEDWQFRSNLKNFKKNRELLNTLTARELDVAQLITEGLNNQKMAKELGIAEKTVKVHRSSIYRKLRVRTALEVFKIIDSVCQGGKLSAGNEKISLPKDLNSFP